MIGPQVANTWWNAMKNGDLALGRIPLHFAALDGLNEIVELLIAKGADVNANYGIGYTLLDVAARSKQYETPNLIRKHGGKTDAELKAAGK